MICFALYRSEEPKDVNPDEGVIYVCVGVFGAYEDAIQLARENLAEGYSITIDLGHMTEAEWDALEEVPDDFAFSPPAVDASDPHVPHTGNPSQRDVKARDA